MTRRTLVPLTGVLALLALGGEARAQALPSDLTGTWIGKLSCKGNLAEDGTAAKAKVKNLTLLMSLLSFGPNGAAYAAEFEGDGYSARSVDVGGTGSGKGAAAFVLCGSSADTWTGKTELWRMDFKVNPEKQTGKLSGEAIFNDTDEEASPEGGASATCKTSWKRISVTDPQAVGCE